MNYKIFNISIPNSQESEEELNKFLNSVSIISVHKELVNCERGTFWSFVVEYYKKEVRNTNQKKSIDYREVLSELDFAYYCKLREWRKEKAGKKGVPVFTIFTNKQLASIASCKEISKTALGKINGFGEKRMEDYGEEILEILKDKEK